jgi:hypothetical protein
MDKQILKEILDLNDKAMREFESARLALDSAVLYNKNLDIALYNVARAESRVIAIVSEGNRKVLEMLNKED